MSAPALPTPPNETPKRRRLGLGWWLAIVGTIIIGLPVAALTAWSIGATRRAEAELARIRAAGEPVTAAELEAYYAAPPAEQDVTQLWLDATQPLMTREYAIASQNLPCVGIGERIPIVPPVGQPWPQQAASEKLLADYAASIQLMHEAAQRGGAARYPVSYAPRFEILGDHFSQLRRGVWLLQLESWAHAHRGESAAAAKSINSILMLAHSTDTDPLFVGLLISAAIAGVGREQIADLLPSVRFTDDELRDMQTHLRVLDFESAFHRVLIGERAYGTDLFCDRSRWNGLEQKPSFAAEITWGDDLAAYLELYDQLIATTQSRWCDGCRQREQILTATEASLYYSRWTRVRRPLTTELIPGIGAVTDATSRVIAYLRTADAGLAAELYRRKHGGFPDRLDQLVPEFLPAVPVDPYDGGPLRYVVNDQGCVVYSIGQDGVDDGGQRDPSFPGRPDVTFRVPRPATP